MVNFLHAHSHNMENHCLYCRFPEVLAFSMPNIDHTVLSLFRYLIILLVFSTAINRVNMIATQSLTVSLCYILAHKGCMNLIAMTTPYEMSQVFTIIMVCGNPWLLNIHKLTGAHFCRGEGSVLLFHSHRLSNLPSKRVVYQYFWGVMCPCKKGR